VNTDLQTFDVTVIGAGPAGLAAALEADRQGAKTLLIEREARLGGILKQCIHDGFGIVRYGEKLSGPEYAERFIERLPESGVTVWPLSFVRGIERVPVRWSRPGGAGEHIREGGVRDETAWDHCALPPDYQ
jgi:thioredoxin reductase